MTELVFGLGIEGNKNIPTEGVEGSNGEVTEEKEKQEMNEDAEGSGEDVESNDETGEDEKSVEDSDDAEGEVLLEVAGFDMSELTKEYTELGRLSEESYEELAEHGFSKEIVDAYIRGVEAQTVELADKDVTEVMDVAGGAEKYERMVKWAAKEFSEEDRTAFNKVIQSGDKYLIKLAVQGLTARYEKEYGRTPKLLKGGRGDMSSAEKESFKSVSEMKEAMNDKRYGKDPDYTAEVEKKVIQSSFIKNRRN